MLRTTLAAVAVVFTVSVANAEALKLTDTQMDTVANAEALKLTAAQMDQITAGSFVFAGGSQPFLAEANPIGGQGGLAASFGPHSGLHPNGAAWVAHSGGHTPLDFGGDS